MKSRGLESLNAASAGRNGIATVCLFFLFFCMAFILLPLSGGSLAEWSARQTRNPAALGLSIALATCWICSWSSLEQILGHACK